MFFNLFEAMNYLMLLHLEAPSACVLVSNSLTSAVHSFLSNYLNPCKTLFIFSGVFVPTRESLPFPLSAAERLLSGLLACSPPHIVVQCLLVSSPRAPYIHLSS